MSWCAAYDECLRPGEWIATPVHEFSGYGFWIVYHPECCPLECDGSLCEKEHPYLAQRIHLIALRAIYETYRSEGAWR